MIFNIYKSSELFVVECFSVNLSDSIKMQRPR